MSQYTSYFLYQKYVKYGDQDWLPAYPNVFSADGDGTMSPVIKQDDDPGCGYTPPAEYRWVDLNPSTDYYCLDCGTNGVKLSGTYGSGATPFSVNCNSSTTLTSADTAYSGITYASIGNCVTEIGDRAFMYRGALSGVSIPSTVTTIGASAFTHNFNLIDCLLPDSVTSIGAQAFERCVSLTNFVLWDTVTSIGGNAFTECDSLISVNIPTGLTTIPYMCFYGCGALQEIVIPNGVTTIQSSAFGVCTGLSKLIIGSGVTSIGESAFNGCSGLTSITIEAITPPTLGSGYGVFGGTNDCPIYVPAGSVDTYKSASGWSDYASRIQAITV